MDNSFLDRLGNKHILRTGAVAAQMVQAGEIPELTFGQTGVMRDQLISDKFFKVDSDKSLVPTKGFQYVVYRGNDYSGAPDPLYRTMTSWSEGRSMPFSKDLDGWGKGPEDQIIDVPGSKFNPAMQIYLARITVSVSTEKEKSVQIDLEKRALTMQMEIAQYEDKLTRLIKAVETVSLKMDPIYAGVGDVIVDMRIQAFDLHHAKFIAEQASNPFVDKMIEKFDAKHRQQVKASSDIHLFEDEPAVSIKSPRP